MNDYLLTLVLNPDLEEKGRNEILDSVKKKMTEDGGKVEKDDNWGLRDLAFPVNKKQKGFYVHFEFSSKPSVAAGLDKTLKLEEDILRYLLVRK